MIAEQGSSRGPWRDWLRLVLALGLLSALALGQAEQAKPAGPVTIPAFRQADNVYVLTVEGVIDAVTELSIRRRVAEAEAAGADALVIELDSPGGELGPVLEISNEIKGSAIANSVAWINPDAYSGGAIVALACREIVVADPAAFGDAFVIIPGPQGIRGLSEDERVKILPPLLSDLTDSARRNGYDEYMVQAIVSDELELWAVQEIETGKWYFVDEYEVRQLFEGEPPRGKPILTSIPLGKRNGDKRPRPEPNLPGEGTTEAAESGADGVAEPAEGSGGSADPAAPPTGADEIPPDQTGADETAADGESTFRSAGGVFDDVAPEITVDQLPAPSQRPVFSSADRGKFDRPLYLCDGTGPIVLRHDQLLFFDIATQEVRTDAELLDYFGATRLTRLDENWSEGLVRVLTSPGVRGLLIILFLVGMFVEIVSPGMVVPAVVALGALLTLIAPPALIGMADWWEIALILGGILAILIEVIFLVGFGLLGVAGLLALFTGLVALFLPAPGAPQSEVSQALLHGVTVVVLSTATAGLVIFFLVRRMESLPIMRRLILAGGAEDPGGERPEGDALLATIGTVNPDGPQPGSLATTKTPLYPGGLIEFEGRTYDAESDLGFIEAGRPVRLLKFGGFAWVVEPAGETDAHQASENAPPSEDES